ncbi:hypothetical protein JXB02_01545 [Candidatus Woesearchaeota archaeon]|nr:hypothetical protein [Candidatus Woesearchaeota archaeon]
MNMLKKALLTAAAVYTIATGAQAQTEAKPVLDRVHSETSFVENEKKEGLPYQRVWVTGDKVQLRYDAGFDLAKGDRTIDKAGLYVMDVLSDGRRSMNLAVVNLGNYDGNDETWGFSWIRLPVGDATAALDYGMSVQQHGPGRSYVYGMLEGVKAGPLTLYADAALMAKDRATGEERNRLFGFVAGSTDDAFLSIGNTINATSVFAFYTGSDALGTLTWYKHDRETGVWHIKNRIGAGKKQEGFYTTKNAHNVARIFTVPSFYDTHLPPPMTKGTYSLGLDLSGDDGSMTVKALPGVQTAVGMIGLGAETQWTGKTTDTGLVASYYTTTSVGDLDAKVEANYNARTRQADAWITLDYTLR